MKCEYEMEFMENCYVVSLNNGTTDITAGTVESGSFVNLSADIENASPEELAEINSIFASGCSLGAKVTSKRANVPKGISRYAVKGPGSVEIKPAVIKPANLV
tara:strand:- start:84 stop:392 length:309 start_codon:yes stop_codon:yes gene_type:complete